MIPEALYEEYLSRLLEGDRRECSRIVQQLLDQEIEIKQLYTDLFQRSLYQVGELWEYNRISVAKEHLATSMTEVMFHLVYPRLFETAAVQQRRRAVISCAVNEFHQIGGKMVADLLDLNGWDAHFLGTNTPVDHMLEYLQEQKPDLVGLSLSVYFNVGSLKTGIEAIRTDFPELQLVVGGQAFRWGGTDFLGRYPRTRYIASLDQLEAEVLG